MSSVYFKCQKRCADKTPSGQNPLHTYLPLDISHFRTKPPWTKPPPYIIHSRQSISGLNPLINDTRQRVTCLNSTFIMLVIIKYLVCIYIFTYQIIYIYIYIYIYVYIYIYTFIYIIIIIIKLYGHIQRALHDELECSLALTHIVPIYIYICIYYKMKYGK